MRILLDECVPIQVCGALPGHEVTSAQRMGWGGLRNGALLDATEQAGFDLFIVAEKKPVTSPDRLLEAKRKARKKIGNRSPAEDRD